MWERLSSLCDRRLRGRESKRQRLSAPPEFAAASRLYPAFADPLPRHSKPRIARTIRVAPVLKRILLQESDCHR